MKKQIPLFLISFVGFTYVIQYFIPHSLLATPANMFNEWILIIAAFAIWLGILNLIRISLQKVYTRKKGWGYALVTIAGFLLMAVIGMFFSGGRAFSEAGTNFDWLYRNVYNPMSAAMFAMLAFFVASASYRAFRARSKEATVLLLTATIIMLGRVPIGDYLTFFMPHGYRMSDLADWIMFYANTAGQRAILIGIALGTVSMSLRIILGIERSVLGGE